MTSKFNPGKAPAQIGIPDVLDEEAPLASEVVDGGVLSRRRKEALGALRAEFVDRPPDISPEEWRVAVAILAPPDGHIGRVPGSAGGRLGKIRRARECFPMLSPSGALQRFDEVARRPAVVEFLARIRSLELLDVIEQRAMVREVLHLALSKASMLDDPALCATPSEWAKVASAIALHAKILIDLDGLATKPGENERALAPAEDDAGAGPDVTAKIQRVADDLRARRTVPA